MCHVTSYNQAMIKSFADKYSHELYIKGKSKKFPPEIISRAILKMEYINLATSINDLKVPPSNRLHELSGERKGQYSISVNAQWRICFRYQGGDAFDVELTDYH